MIESLRPPMECGEEQSNRMGWHGKRHGEWYGPEYALDDLVVYLMYGHKREHAPQLEAVLERTVAIP